MEDRIQNEFKIRVVCGCCCQLVSHQFCTPYCQDKLAAQKQENLRQLEARIQAAFEAGQ
jgi:hypothetical protein